MSLLFPQLSLAETSTADFLEWERNAQHSFIQTSIGMFTAIAANIQPDIATCMDDWYYSTPSQLDERNDEILAVMPKYKTFHPTTVIYAYAENACGAFGAK